MFGNAAASTDMLPFTEIPFITGSVLKVLLPHKEVISASSSHKFFFSTAGRVWPFVAVAYVVWQISKNTTSSVFGRRSLTTS